MLVIAAAVGPLYRLGGGLLGIYSTEHWMWLFAAPFANVDSLALGGILAYASVVKGDPLKLKSRLPTYGLWVGAPLAVCLRVLDWINASGPRFEVARLGFENTMWALLFVWLIDRASRGFVGLVGRVLESRLLMYLGKISYGLYVVHLFMPDGVAWLFRRSNLPYPENDLAEFVLLVTATVVIAACSWHVYERPLNDLKQRFST